MLIFALRGFKFPLLSNRKAPPPGGVSVSGGNMEIDEDLVGRIVRQKTRASFWIGVVAGLLLGAIAGYAIGVYVATDNVTVITYDKGIET